MELDHGRSLFLSFSLSVQEAESVEKERRKKRKKEKNLVVFGGDDAFSESFDDRPKIIAAESSVGHKASRLKCNTVAGERTRERDRWPVEIIN